MPYDPLRHHRRSIRLQGYDYSQAGAYFVTICVQGGEQRLGKIIEGEMLLNDAGWMVQTLWERLPEWFPTVELDAYVVMPNHFHAILVITDPVGMAHVAAPVVVTPVVAAPVVAAPILPAPAVPAPVVAAVAAPAVPAPVVAAVAAPILPAPVVAAPRGAHKGRPYDLPDENGPNYGQPALGDIVGAFKSLTTDAYIIGVYYAAWPPFYRRVWQRNYYERIIRHERALKRIREYIYTNPQRWERDRNNSKRQDEDDFDRWLDLYDQGDDP